MFLSQDHEDKAKQNGRKIENLERETEALDRESAALFKELEVTPEQVQKFAADESNFSPENWQCLQEEKRKVDERINRALDGITDPTETLKRLRDRHVARHWIPVR